MITVNKLIPRGRGLAPALVRRAASVTLDWDTRQKSRFDAVDSTGRALGVFLPRGSTVRGGDVLVAEDGSLVRVVATPQPVMVVRACAEHGNAFDLLRAAYHLGNRHVALELHPDRLQLEPDNVLADLLRRMHLEVAQELQPFEPEAGAYGEGHGLGHDPAHGHGKGHQQEHDPQRGHGHAHGHEHGHDHGHQHARAHDHDRQHGHGHGDDHGHQHGHGHGDDHGHQPAHGHGDDHGHQHARGHDHADGHPHDHGHDHGGGHDHPHDHGHDPIHGHPHDHGHVHAPSPAAGPDHVHGPGHPHDHPHGHPHRHAGHDDDSND